MATPLGVEIFCVVTDPLRLMAEAPKPIAPDSYQRPAATFQKDIEKGIRAFLANEKSEPDGPPPPERDYLELNRRISMAYALIGLEGTTERRTFVTAQLADPVLGAAYILQFDKAVSFLHLALPRRTITTLGGGIQNVEPPALELSPFWRALEVVKDPRVLLRDLREHILVSDQVEVVKQLYPRIYDEYTAAMLDGIRGQRAKSADWEPTLTQAQQIETLLLVSRFSPDLAAELQERARMAEVDERAEEQQQAGGGSDPGGKAVDSYQTSTQRITYR